MREVAFGGVQGKNCKLIISNLADKVFFLTFWFFDLNFSKTRNKMLVDLSIELLLKNAMFCYRWNGQNVPLDPPGHGTRSSVLST